MATSSKASLSCDMATSAAETTSENELLLTCSVCLEVFNNPHELKCRHTFCLQCVKKITQNTTVKCPECRIDTQATDVKKDFKTQQWVDLYSKEKDNDKSACVCKETATKVSECEKLEESLPNADSENDDVTVITVKCDVCESRHDVIDSHCVDCKSNMCKSCHKAHEKFKPDWHKVISFAVYLNQSKDVFNNIVSQLQVKKGEVEEMKNTVERRIKSHDHQKLLALKQVDYFRDSLLEKINAHCSKQRELVSTEFSNRKSDYNDLQEEYTKALGDINDQINLIKDMLKSENLPSMCDTASEVDMNIKVFVKEMTARLPDASVRVNPPAVVVEGEAWDTRSGPQVKVGIQTHIHRPHTSLGPSTSAISASMPTFRRYYQVLTQKCELREAALVSACSNCMCLISNQIWLGCENHIGIYDLHLQRLQTVERGIKTRSITYNKNSRHIILVQDGGNKNKNGLYCYDLAVPHKSTCIAEGVFSDASYDSGTHLLYALSWHNDPDSSVLVITEEKGKYRISDTLNISCTSSPNNRICFDGSSLYISSYIDNCVKQYSIDGNLLETFGMKGIYDPKFNGPILCGVDEAGDILVADQNNNRLLVLSKRECNTVLLQSSVEKPIHAAVGDHQTVWVVMQKQPNSSKICKFMRKT